MWRYSDLVASVGPSVSVRSAAAMSLAEGVRVPSATGAATAPHPASALEEQTLLLGETRKHGTPAGPGPKKSPWRYLNRCARGEYVSHRVLTAIAFMAMGAVALVLNVTVERVAQAPVSVNWIQGLATQGDPHQETRVNVAAQNNASQTVHPPIRLGSGSHELKETLERETLEIVALRRGTYMRQRHRGAAGLEESPGGGPSQAVDTTTKDARNTAAVTDEKKTAVEDVVPGDTRSGASQSSAEDTAVS